MTPPNKVIISRYIGESFKVGDEIEIAVTNVRGKRVHLAVFVPAEVRVTKPEVRT